MKSVIALLFSFCLSLAAADTVNLSGQWDFQLDSADQGLTATNFLTQPFSGVIHLPGTVAQAGEGTPLDLPPVLLPLPPENLNLNKGITFGRDTNYAHAPPLEHLEPKFSYVGPAWYRRHFDLPAGWTNRDVQLVLERALWETRVWVNGRFLGTRNSLTTPHRYEIGPALKPGRNEIVIRVDNRRQLAIGNPHAYTDQSQTIWNGLIGRLVLEARDRVRLDDLELRPDLAHNGVEITVRTHNDGGTAAPAELSLKAGPDNFKGPGFPVLKLPVSVASGDDIQVFFFPLGTNIELWSEFNPKLYRMQATLAGANFHSAATGTWGMREFKTAGDQLTINGRPVFLRGDVNCCEFPLTGYPPMTGKLWEKIFTTAKAYGLNHMRFHTWCPPEAAFAAADRLGFYLEVELPDWSFKIGQDAAVTDFFRREGERMIREYGNHPAWVMLTMGNELKGDYHTLDDLETYFRGLDPQLLYDSTTYPSSARGKVPGPVDDYFISQDTPRGRVRGQDIFNNTVPNTETNFSAAAAGIPVPLITHEVGQYCVYPNLAEIPKYKGVLRALNFEAIRNDLKSKGRLAEAPAYTLDSGKLAALLYKEEVERALRTTNQAGFELLQLNDFPGQGTSTVGLLDAFWDSKGIITPAEFHKFCAPVVPLLLLPKRVYQNNETFDAGIEVANFGPMPFKEATLTWNIFDGNREIGAGTLTVPSIPLGHGTELGRIRQSLAGVKHAARLKVTVALAGTTIANDWNVWVYPVGETETGTGMGTNAVAIFTTANAAFYQALGDGQRVLLLPSEAEAKSPLAAEFVTVFWNPVMFPNQPGSMGAMIEAGHPAFADFPTDGWTDWQWWELLHRSWAFNLDNLPARVDMPFRFVDKFNRNALPAAIFEAKVGPGKLLVCTLDITGDLTQRVAARQLRRSLLDYMGSDRFQPRGQLTPADLKQLF